MAVSLKGFCGMGPLVSVAQCLRQGASATSPFVIDTCTEHKVI